MGNFRILSLLVVGIFCGERQTRMVLSLFWNLPLLFRISGLSLLDSLLWIITAFWLLWDAEAPDAFEFWLIRVVYDAIRPPS